jgi:hypothetical protein
LHGNKLDVNDDEGQDDNVGLEEEEEAAALDIALCECFDKVLIILFDKI